MNQDLILLVDDEADMLENCSRLLRSMDYSPLTASNGKEALQRIEEESPVLVLSDMKMPKMGGIELINQVKDRWPGLPVILFTAFGSIESAVEAIKEGAFDYLPKPFTADQLRHSIQRALEAVRLARENRALKDQLHGQFKFDNIIGKSKGIRKVIGTIKKIASNNSNVLIFGESGSGKELIARSVHANSRRSNKPFVPLDCAALPESLMEAELFGHEKGSFTGAHASREGIFETANTGTLFLDEIGELGMELQVKLLRVLQERRIRKVGGRKEIAVDVRVITATNMNLKEAIKERKFREELYYRLNVISIEIPPLRERIEDIPLLCDSFLKGFFESNELPFKPISKRAMERLKAYHWPGNIRELQNCLERAASLAEGESIGPEDLSESISQPDWMELEYSEAKKNCLESFQKKYMENLLKRCDGKMSRASELSGMPRMTVYRIMKKIDMLSDG